MTTSNQIKDRKKRRKVIQRIRMGTRVLTFLVLVGLSAVLAFRFYVMLYFPGTEGTAALYEYLRPRWFEFEILTQLLYLPVKGISKCIEFFMPPEMLQSYPQMPAAKLMAAIAPAKGVDYPGLYPGNAEWYCLLAIPFWAAVLPVVHRGAWFLAEHKDAVKRLNLSMDMISLDMLIPERPDDEEPVREKPRKGKPEQPDTVNDSAEPAEHKPATPESTMLLNRLHQFKAENIKLSLPRIEQPDRQYREYTEEEWEAFRKEQGDLMARHVIRDLQRENRMLQVQQQQLRSTFSQYFSPRVMQYLEENRAIFENMQNQQRRISVMFCDIRGFSSYSQTASSDDLVAFLGEYFEIASYIILHQYDGVISKLMGDGLMAYWGFPMEQPDHAYIATRAAMDILREVDLRNKTKPDAVPLHIGIGIASGDAIVGNIGSTDFKDFTLVGVPVNLASRLDEANKQLQTSLLISANTFQGLQGRVPCHDCGAINIRGWQEAERVFAPQIQYAGPA